MPPMPPTPRARLLFDIHRGAWDGDLCRLFRVPLAMLPEVKDSAGDFGTAIPGILDGPVAIRGIAGDQQAAAAGQACFEPGMMKSTYGTGCFALLNTGTTPVASKNRLLTTIACQLNGRRTYALEGAIFIAGAAVQWLRDGLGIIGNAGEADALAAAADPAQQVYLVPAFTGLGAPYWDADARGAIHGLSRGTTKRELVRAALEMRGLPDARPRRGHARRLGRPGEHGPARRWRDDSVRVDDAVSCRHPGCTRRPARGDGDDRARCGLSRWACLRHFASARGFC